MSPYLLCLIEVIGRSYPNSGPFVFDTFRLLVVTILRAFITDIFFVLHQRLRVIYKKHNAAHILRQLPVNNTRCEHSVLIMINIVVALFLIYCALHTRCTIKFITDEFDGHICRIAVFAVVLNSAVNSLAYALFKQDIKN